MHYLLVYDIAPDYLARRGAYRNAHLAYAWEYADAGTLVLGGTLGDPIDGAMLLFDVESPDAVAAFAEGDPYVIEGLIAKWTVRPWNTTIGDGAIVPTRAV